MIYIIRNPMLWLGISTYGGGVLSVVCIVNNWQLLFALVQYEWSSERTGIFSGSYKDDRDQQ
jgi:hypothetical protein